VAKSITGREPERAVLDQVLESDSAELVALYGRRRIGKTYLIRQHVGPRSGLFLEVTGTRDGSAALQRRRFRESVEEAFGTGPLPDFSSWDAALSHLVQLVQRRAADAPAEPITLFFDELPWLATPRSGMLESLDYHWNRNLSRIPEVKVVLCGSAASWMIRRVVDAKGGLHNRITRRIRLDPFTVRETAAFLRARRIRLNRMETLELYMALGGVPYYLGMVPRGESVAGAIGALCFERSGQLQGEFDRIFPSLFADHEQHVAILKALGKRKEGVTRQELIDDTAFASGGSLNRKLQELEEAGFISRIEPYRKKVKSTVFRVIDEFSLFHLRWVAGAAKGVLARGGAGHWRSVSRTPSYRAWAGYAFETVCLKHARELEVALGIENLVESVGSWRHIPRERSPNREGAQVDLLFDRSDDVINLCEVKFTRDPFTVTKAHARELREKIALFERHTKTTKRVVLTLVAPAGLKRNTWSEDLVDRVVDAKALF